MAGITYNTTKSLWNFELPDTIHTCTFICSFFLFEEFLEAKKGPRHYCDVIMGAMASQITSLTIVYSTAKSGADQRKHQSSASLAFVRGIHQTPVNSLHKGPVTQKMFPFDDVIMRYWGCTVVIPFMVTLYERNVVSNHHPNNCLFNSLFMLTLKILKPHITGILCEESPMPWLTDSLHKVLGAFPYHDVTMIGITRQHW